MKKNLLVAGAMVLALASCGKNSKSYKDLKVQYDSIALVNQNYEQDLRETDSLVASVLTNFQEISAVEGMINVNPMKGDMKMSDKDRIKDNMQLISDKLQASNNAINELNEKLAKSGKENYRLRNTLNALKKQLEDQKARVTQLTEELKRKDIAIGSLDSMVNNLHGDVSRLNEATAKQAADLAAQDKALNTVRFCIGTSSDLKDMNLMKNGRVVTENANMNYFTTTDMRELSQIPLMSKKAKLLTIHPASSYELVRGNDKMLTLSIKDPKAFWSSTKILIVEVD
ncbi:hypothetical protein [Porphyromonas pogonae]|uniref:Cbp1 family collagen-binding glycoprotein adhesin n=1 Tax=Porphyromonas pogonae TaxID=867595 RepID=UPI002E78A962|nr:hypothetical protein [Porphyromonas pogonae]